MFDVIEYLILPGNDCLFGKHIGSLQVPQIWGPIDNYDECDTWCQDRRNCAGYSRLGDVCYFKNKDCKNDLFKNEGRSTFLLIGKYLAFNEIL